MTLPAHFPGVAIPCKAEGAISKDKLEKECMKHILACEQMAVQLTGVEYTQEFLP